MLQKHSWFDGVLFAVIQVANKSNCLVFLGCTTVTQFWFFVVVIVVFCFCFCSCRVWTSATSQFLWVIMGNTSWFYFSVVILFNHLVNKYNQCLYVVMHWHFLDFIFLLCCFVHLCGEQKQLVSVCGMYNSITIHTMCLDVVLLIQVVNNNNWCCFVDSGGEQKQPASVWRAVQGETAAIQPWWHHRNDL